MSLYDSTNLKYRIILLYRKDSCTFSPQVPISKSHLSRLRLPHQSLKRVGHEGKPCIKGEQRHPPCLSRVPWLSWLGGNRCHQNRVHHRPGYNVLYIDIHTYILGVGTATNFRTAVYHGTEVRTAIRTAIYRVYYFKVKCVSGRHDGSSGPRDTQRDSPTEIRTASLSRVDWFLSSAPLTAWLHAGASTGPSTSLRV